jgi:hypothetical protein
VYWPWQLRIHARSFLDYPPKPCAQTDDALVELARLRRRVDDAGAGFDAADVACHSDVAPHTNADEDSRPMTFIDSVLEHVAGLAP